MVVEHFPRKKEGRIKAGEKQFEHQTKDGTRILTFSYEDYRGYRLYRHHTGWNQRGIFKFELSLMNAKFKAENRQCVFLVGSAEH